MHKLNIASGADPHQRKAICFIGAIKHGVAAYERGSWSRKGTIADRTEWSQGNDIIQPGSTLRAKMYKTWKSITVVLVEVIFRTGDLVDPVYFGETLPSRLRRRYAGPSVGCAGHTTYLVMSIRFSIPSRGSDALHFTDARIRIPFHSAARRRATKCVRSGRDNKSRCSGSATSRNGRTRTLLLSSFFLAKENDVGDVGDAVHLANLPAPPAEFDVRDNIEAEGDSPSPERILHLGPSLETAGGRFRVRERADKILGLCTLLAFRLFAESKCPAAQTFAQTIQAAIFFPPGNYGRPAIGHSRWIWMAEAGITETEILRKGNDGESFGRVGRGRSTLTTTMTTTTSRETEKSAS
ncbi:Uncharacterized protein DBV15_08196, partial [Temnothorax longispinosus]